MNVRNVARTNATAVEDRMRILWVKAGRILPVDTGGKIRSFNILRHLSERFDVVMLSYYDGPIDCEYERALAEALPGVIAIATGTSSASMVPRLGRYLARLFHKAPYAVTNFTHPVVRRHVGELLASGRFDVAVCDFLAASLNFAEVTPIPVVLFQHNVESALWDRRARYERNPFKRLAFEFEAAKMRRFERLTVNRFDRIIAVSDHDRALMSGMTDAARISVVPTGVDSTLYRRLPGAPRRDGAPVVLFLGSMDWEPNIDGVEYFCRDIWPTVSAAVPDARFRIVGRNPHPRVSRLAGGHVEVTGSVPSVVEHLHEAAVVVVPLRVGGGTRLKIYEAMAAGRAVVSTTVGAEGLDITDGDDIVLADTAVLFASSVVELLRNGNRRAEVEQRAAALAARFDWSAIAESFAESLATASATHRTALGAPAEVCAR